MNQLGDDRYYARIGELREGARRARAAKHGWLILMLLAIAGAVAAAFAQDTASLTPPQASPLLVTLSQRTAAERVVRLDVETMELHDLVLPAGDAWALDRSCWTIPGGRFAHLDGNSLSHLCVHDARDPSLILRRVLVPETLHCVTWTDGSGWVEGAGLVLMTGTRWNGGALGIVVWWDGEAPTASVHLLDDYIPGVAALAAHGRVLLLENDPRGWPEAILLGRKGVVSWFHIAGGSRAACALRVGSEVWIGWNDPPILARYDAEELALVGEVPGMDSQTTALTWVNDRLYSRTPFGVRELHPSGVVIDRVFLGLPGCEWFRGPWPLVHDSLTGQFLAPTFGLVMGPILCLVREDLGATRLVPCPEAVGRVEGAR